MRGMRLRELRLQTTAPLRLRVEKDLGECRFRMVESGISKELRL
jgi:hypothetical protein